MSRCGRCKGRGSIKSLRGFEMALCPDCDGRGVRTKRSTLGSRTVSVPVDGATCKVCGDAPAVASHHVIAQQRLNRYLTADLAQKAKADRRNTVPVCHRCHHGIESGALHLEAHELHPHFATFVFGYDLAAALPRYMQEWAA